LASNVRFRCTAVNRGGRTKVSNGSKVEFEKHPFDGPPPAWSSRSSGPCVAHFIADGPRPATLLAVFSWHRGPMPRRRRTWQCPRTPSC